MDFIYDPSLVLYLPLHEKDGSSFMSKDAYGHLCTATGALWRPNGRLLDGLDDFLSIPDSPTFTFTAGNPFSIIVWVCPTAIADYDGVVGKWDNDVPANKEWLFRFGASSKFEFRYYDSANATSRGRVTTDTIPTNTFTQIVGTCDGSIVDPNGGTKIYINAVQKDTTDLSTTGTYGGMVNGTAPLYMGNIENQADVDFTGIIGEIWIYKNRVLNITEILHNYLATKWRYR